MSILNKYFKHSTKSKLNLGLMTSGVHYDIRIQNLLEILEKNKKDSIKIFSDTKSLEIIGYILNKTQRNENELKIICSYLEKLNKFITLLNVDKDDLESLLKNLSVHLKCEKYAKGKVVFRYGEKGHKFFIVLKGSVNILILKENKIRLTFFEYINHLIILYAIGEIGLMQKIIKSNRNCYDVNEKDIIDFVDKYNKKLEKLISSRKKNRFFNFDELDIKHLTQSLQEIYYQIEQNYSNPKEYIKLIFPYDINEKEYQNYNEKNLIIYSYFEVTKLIQGNFFGEIALEKSSSRRTATIICYEDCLFGTLSREAYNNSLREIQVKERRFNVKTLLSFKIFSNLNWNIFQNHFFNFFKIIHVSRNENVIQQGSPIHDIFFVRDGQYEMTSELSNKKIDKLIQHLRNKRNINDKNLKAYDDDDEKKRFLKICILKDKDVLGLYDIFDLDNINSVMTVKCTSGNGTLYCIERKVFLEITSRVKTVEINFIEFTNLRRRIMINRLNILRKTNEIGHIESKKENLFDNINNLLKNNIDETKVLNKYRLFSANPKNKKLSLKNNKNLFKKHASNFNLKNEKEKKIKLLINDNNSSNNKVINFKQYYESIPNKNNIQTFEKTNNYYLPKSLSYAINTDSTSFKSRNYFQRYLNSFFSGIKTTIESPKKINKDKENEKMLKIIVGSLYKKKSNSLNFKPKSKGDIYVNKMIKSRNSKSNIFVDILQYDSLYSNESKNNLSLNSFDDKSIFSKQLFTSQKSEKLIKLCKI